MKRTQSMDFALGETRLREYIGSMQLSKLKLIVFIALLSVPAFAAPDEEPSPESEGQIGSFHDEDSRKPKKKGPCERWMNMQSTDVPTENMQRLPKKIMNFSRPSPKQMGDNDEPSGSEQMQ
jgi:hypothetical protein